MRKATPLTPDEPRKTWAQWQKANAAMWYVTPIAIIILIYTLMHWYNPNDEAFDIFCTWLAFALGAGVTIVGLYVIVYRYWKYTKDGTTY